MHYHETNHRNQDHKSAAAVVTAVTVQILLLL